MKIFITGIKGQLGTDLRILAEKSNIEYRGCGRSTSSEEWYNSINLANNYEDLKKAVNDFNPDVIVHCAAWTAVDLAEISQKETYQANVIATRNVTKVAAEIGCKLVYISSDYVYGVNDDRIISESETTEPLSYYGKTKLLGENEALAYDKSFILRVSWLHGRHGNNFPKTMVKLAESRYSIQVVDDQIGRPTNTEDLSRLILEIANSEKYGIYNVSNEGPYVSWKEYAEYVLKDTKVSVNGISSKEYYENRNAANRPLNSRLSTDKLSQNGFSKLPDWRESLSYLYEQT